MEEKPELNNETEESKKFVIKEGLDKIGFGFGSQQFINILFLLSGASIFLLGLINSLKVVFGSLISFFIERSNNLGTNKKLISLGGIVFGFSFLLMSVALYIKSILIFSIAILISGVSIIFYGESRNIFQIKNRKFVEKVAKYGLIITAISLFFAAFLMDKFPLNGKRIMLNIFGNLFSIKIYGFLIVFEITAISFIIAGYVLSKVKVKKIVQELPSKINYRGFFKNKVLLLLIITNVVLALVQTIGYSYYGVFIFKNFSKDLFGGFLNVAMVFLISVFNSVTGYFIVKINTKTYRKFPMIVFGIAMITVMPLTYFLKQDLIFLTMATIIGIIGNSIVGVTNSLLSIDLVSHESRQGFLSFTNLLSIPFFIVFAPILAFVAHYYGLNILFLMLTIILIILIIILIIAGKIFKKELP